MQSPRNPLDFLYWVFFKPISLRRYINGSDPSLGSVASLLTRRHAPSTRTLRNYALFYTLLVPCLLGFGTAGILSALGEEVNWTKLTLYLLVGMFVCATFSVGFSVVFLLLFSPAAAVVSSGDMDLSNGMIFTLTLGLGFAYGLIPKRAAWGMTASFVYGLVFVAMLGAASGAMIGLAFLLGYFRIPIFLVEAPFAWALSRLAERGDALSLWHLNPLVWDELVWFPLPGLERHLQALQQQNEAAARNAIRLVEDSFHQDKTARHIQHG